MRTRRLALESIAADLYSDKPIDPQPEMERRFVNGRWDYVATDRPSFLSGGGTLDRSEIRKDFVRTGNILLMELQKRGITDLAGINIEGQED